MKQMGKNKRMAKLIELLAKLESSDYSRLSAEGREYLGDLWVLLGMPRQEDLKPNDSDIHPDEEDS